MFSRGRTLKRIYGRVREIISENPNLILVYTKGLLTLELPSTDGWSYESLSLSGRKATDIKYFSMSRDSSKKTLSSNEEGHESTPVEELRGIIESKNEDSVVSVDLKFCPEDAETLFCYFARTLHKKTK